MGTPFIIIVFAIIFLCIAVAIIMAVFMRTNHGFEGAEAEHAPLVPSVDQHTGTLPPFMPLPHQTQPLSEIYYYNEQVSASQPSAPLTLSEPSSSPTQNTSASPPTMPPPSGPLPGYYPNQ